MASAIAVNVNEAAKQIELHIGIKGVKEFQFRIFVAKLLMMLAGKILGTKTTVEVEIK